jgi:hypothetical protein
MGCRTMTLLPQFLRNGLRRLPESTRDRLYDLLMRWPVFGRHPGLTTRRWVRTNMVPSVTLSASEY